jgi:hypothetical protein
MTMNWGLASTRFLAGGMFIDPPSDAEIWVLASVLIEPCIDAVLVPTSE